MMKRGGKDFVDFRSDHTAFLRYLADMLIDNQLDLILVKQARLQGGQLKSYFQQERPHAHIHRRALIAPDEVP